MPELGSLLMTLILLVTVIVATKCENPAVCHYYPLSYAWIHIVQSK